jgi:Family of unknown function (DUF6807)
MKEFDKVVLILCLVAGVVATANAAGAQPMRITLDADTLSIYQGGRVLLHYRYENVPFKPYVKELFSPQGVNILQDAPPGHPHHHGLMFAVAVDGVNFWEEQKAPGRQEHLRFSQVKVGKSDETPCAGFTEHIDWINPRSKKLLLKEQRSVEIMQVKDADVTLLSWQSRLAVPPGKDSVVLTGSHYFGLGMRFVASMDVKGRFRNAAGKAGEVVRGDERLTPANWCAYSAEANGKPVTAAMFGSPDNVRHPTLWFTMAKPFAYMSATMNLYREPLKIASDKPLVLRYAVALWDGAVTDEQISRIYEQWIQNNNTQ